jgi:Ala-tRNA(Pro) deacylase
LRRDGGYMLAVLPASHHIRLPDLRQQIGDDVALADESEIKRLFPDCALGAVPAVGECYDLDVIVDDSIQEQPDVYLEGGDHTTLIHISQAQFTRLMSGARHGRFSVHGLSRAIAALVLPWPPKRFRCVPRRRRFAE